VARVRMCITCWKPERECLCDDEPTGAEIDGMDGDDGDEAA